MVSLEVPTITEYLQKRSSEVFDTSKCPCVENMFIDGKKNEIVHVNVNPINFLFHTESKILKRKILITTP